VTIMYADPTNTNELTRTKRKLIGALPRYRAIALEVSCAGGKAPPAPGGATAAITTALRNGTRVHNAASPLVCLTLTRCVRGLWKATKQFASDDV